MSNPDYDSWLLSGYEDDERSMLINEILSLDAETFQGIDDPSYLNSLSLERLKEELESLKAQIGM